jgi:hypothetical protein
LLIFVATLAFGEENASNPLAKSKNTDVRWQHIDLVDGSRLNDFFIDGSFMATDKLKIKYELHYWETNVSGQSETGLESVVAKAIYFPAEGERGNIKYRLAVGMDWIVDLGDAQDGIGIGSNQVGPFFGVALGLPSKTMLIPLVQQFISYDGNDVNTTAFRLIGLQPLSAGKWLKLDAKIPIDWENDNNIPADVELQFGKNLNEKLALYVEALAGLGSDRIYDWGVGAGLRFKF